MTLPTTPGCNQIVSRCQKPDEYGLANLQSFLDEPCESTESRAPQFSLDSQDSPNSPENDELVQNPSNLFVKIRFIRGFSSYTFANTSVAFVPPKPKLLESAQFISALSIRFRTIGMPSISGSRFSMWADSQIKPPCIINSV